MPSSFDPGTRPPAGSGGQFARRRRALATALLGSGLAAVANLSLSAEATQPSSAGPTDTARAVAEPPALASSAATQGSSSAANARPVDLAAVRLAVEAVQRDPLLGGEEVRKTLRWKDAEAAKKPKPQVSPAWLQGLVAWLSQAGRFLAWLGGAVLVALALVLGRRWWGQRTGSVMVALPPSHVGVLDIRPESLPDDVGGTALQWWRAGQTRAALALLYRAALSRLVHHHGVPVQAATTEHECLSLASARLDPEALDFLRQLVESWLREGYSRHGSQDAVVRRLCTAFDAILGQASKVAEAPQP